MKPTPLLLLCTFFVITACKPAQKPSVSPSKTARNEKTLDQIINQAAKDAVCDKVTPRLLKAVAIAENQKRNDIVRLEKGHIKKITGTWEEIVQRVEDATSHGPTQILGETAKKYGVDAEELRTDPETAFRLTSLILGDEICRSPNVNPKKEMKLGVVAYNAGAGWRKKPPAVQAQAFAHLGKVMKAYYQLG